MLSILIRSSADKVAGVVQVDGVDQGCWYLDIKMTSEIQMYFLIFDKQK